MWYYALDATFQSYVLVTSYWGMAVSRNRTWCEYLGTDFVSFFKSSGGFSKYSYSPSFPTLELFFFSCKLDFRRFLIMSLFFISRVIPVQDV